MRNFKNKTGYIPEAKNRYKIEKVTDVAPEAT